MNNNEQTSHFPWTCGVIFPAVLSQVCVLPRGKMLGGSSAVNGLMYIRGNREDYNQWERLGNPGWGYEDVLPYFIRAEDNQDIDKTDPGELQLSSR